MNMDVTYKTFTCGEKSEQATIVAFENQDMQTWLTIVVQTEHPIVIIDQHDQPIGTLTLEFIAKRLEESSSEYILPKHELLPVQCVKKSDPFPVEQRMLSVVIDGDRIVGVITQRTLQTVRDQDGATLSLIFDSAYEGIVIIDRNQTITSMNQSYRDFLGGLKERDVIGRDVTSVIDNTELHQVVKTGIPERGKVQTIQGQKMVVHRLPIWQEGEIVGAVGMLIFEGMTELHRILQYEATSKAKAVKTEKQGAVQTFETMIGKSPSIQRVKSLARKASRTKASVVIQGESGTGKELFAQGIHHMSSRSEGPFVAINCSAFPENLLESELFGYEGGAFTDARKGGRRGKFEQAHGGTLFLDEVSEMSSSMQAKILRILETKEIVRIGSEQVIHSDFRIVAATNKDLKALVQEGQFRQDLFYRLHVIRLTVPPLRERKEDIPKLLGFHMERLAQEYEVEKKSN
ncbi:sigma-54-dependent Fis family transcriptional regulator [Geomicrobium sp. JCM 19055]|uniref:sigma-54 interaction domain-containing protein n=1 Tax=Geomicrobium sp. JCM 19055 TaxID=1460649 RepID=UPI00045ECF19|nr:sigma 54-interacting transcriptional regulator [Geomicrobium sp. JCM 19055]GAJ98021.1 C4-dicarboxylate transport transcriptional regulatory protein [Geomicrobium sp. JCM 19055]